MNYSTSNKVPIFWIGGGLLAYLSLGPFAVIGVALMWQSGRSREYCRRRGIPAWGDQPILKPAEVTNSLPVPPVSLAESVPTAIPVPAVAAIGPPTPRPELANIPAPASMASKPAARPTAQVAPSEPRPGGIRLHKGLPEIVTQQKCCVIFGTPGSGKGMQLANAIRALKHAKPSTYVFGVDPKNDPKEDGYWEGGAFDRVERKNIAALGANAAADWIFRQVSEFHELSLKSDRPCLLVWDEVMTSKAALAAAEGEKALNDDGRWAGEWIIPPGSKMLADIRFWATGWISSGDSRGIRAWFVTQSPNLDDLPFGGGVKGQLRFVALARPEDGPLVGKLSESKTIVKGQADMEAIRGLCAQSPVGRAIYLSDQERWLPLDRLPNPSGYDRDKCQGQAN